MTQNIRRTYIEKMKPLIVRTLASGCWTCDEPDAQRISLERERGSLPPGVEVVARAQCSKRCVNPDHLRLATEAPRPAGRPISEHDKQRIRRIYQSTLSLGLLADVMECELEYIKDVKRGAFPAITTGLKLGSSAEVIKKARPTPVKKPQDTWPYEGQQMTAGELAKLAGCQTLTMKSRLRRLSPEEAVAFKYKPKGGSPLETPQVKAEPVAKQPVAKAHKAKTKRADAAKTHKGYDRHLVGGELLTISQMAAKANVSRVTIYNRLRVMTPDEAVGPQPLKTGRVRKGHKTYPYQGKEYTATGLMPFSQVGYWTLSRRLTADWDVEAALTTPVGPTSPKRTAPDASSRE